MHGLRLRVMQEMTFMVYGFFVIPVSHQLGRGTICRFGTCIGADIL